MDKLNRPKPSFKALIPFIVFVAFYLLSGIILDAMGVEMAFYQIPAPIAVSIGIIVAFILFEGTIDEKFNEFVKGCGDENIIIMCLIYILAGAFSTVAKASGGVDSVVNFGLSLIPVQFITAGLFLIAAFISISTGTSVGTILAVGPIAIGVAQKGNLPLALVIGALVGGAMFGDNLSIISDTTIAATRTQNVDMKDKFRMNLKIALPAAIITFVILLIVGKPTGAVDLEDLSYNFILIVPYLFVLIAALAGVNVFLVLVSGIILSGLIGLATGAFGGLELAQNIYGGFEGMFEIFLLSLLTGGLAYMVRQEGGIEWAIQKIKGMAKDEKSAELSVSLLTLITDAAVANNTVAIIIIGPVVKEISNDYHVDPRRTASLIDTFSCVMQGFIPYGAQILIAASLTEGLVSPFEIIPYLWYQFILAIVAIISIYVRFTSAKFPWNYEYDLPQDKVDAMSPEELQAHLAK
ncbi:MAG: Na+/H+ antiporter NhaC family protein [Tissierellia bacterium]|nr:Na+/H+ antiporter NhaC family protein [Tissierellia bacterium]